MLIQKQTPNLRHLTTAHLAQTMSLLELNTAELGQKIEAELAKNPALEIIDRRRCPTCQRILRESGLCPYCINIKDCFPEQPIVYFSYINDFFHQPRIREADNDLPDDNFAAHTETLTEYVIRQITPELPKVDRPIAMHILSCLDVDGLLSIPITEIARYHHVTLSHVQSVIRIIQHSDPLGVGSPSPKDALLIQLEALSELCSPPLYTADAIQSGMEFLTPHHCSDLARILKISTSDAKEIVQFISDNLNPFPGRAFWGDIRTGQSDSPPVYHQPDAIITPIDDSTDSPLMVEVFSPYAGILRVNPLFRQAIQEVGDEKTEQWKSDLGRAELLVKCLQQRTTTIVRLMHRLAVIQRDFIMRGDQHLTPQTRANLADVLEVHESTISRAVANKTVQLPNGHIIPLSKFFDRSLQVRTALKQIIEEEETPLSDNAISDMLNELGFSVARRTVAKYRSMEGILPSHLRQSQCVPEAA